MPAIWFSAKRAVLAGSAKTLRDGLLLSTGQRLATGEQHLLLSLGQCAYVLANVTDLSSRLQLSCRVLCLRSLHRLGRR